MSLLSVEDIVRRFGGVTAVSRVSLRITEGEIVGLIGPNGSGKTTLLNCISGALRPQEGSVHLGRDNITGMRPEQRASQGLVRTFQNLNVFPEMSCLANVLLAQEHAEERTTASFFRRTPAGVTSRANECLSTVGLAGKANAEAGSLSYGQQRLLEYAMTLMRQPRMLLLDEPTAGVNPAILLTLSELIRETARAGSGVLIVEHNIALITELCSRVYVMHEGRIIFEGLPAAMVSDEQVIDAYLGH